LTTVKIADQIGEGDVRHCRPVMSTWRLRGSADMMATDFYLIGAKRQRLIGCCRVLKN